ncbi:MAG: hypothetical protein ACSHWY_05665 [Octadecabacter sp.]
MFTSRLHKLLQANIITGTANLASEYQQNVGLQLFIDFFYTSGEMSINLQDNDAPHGRHMFLKQAIE